MSSTPRGYTSFPSQADLFYFCTTSSTSEEDLNIHYAPPSKSSLKIGVLVLGSEQVQLLDLAVVDLLAKIGRNRISKLHVPPSTLEEAVDELDIRYNSFDNAPHFDILIVPGSFSSNELPVSATAFLAQRSSNPHMIAVLSVSSGILNLVQSGVLHQKRAAAPAAFRSTLEQRFPETAWQDMPWTRHDKFWSSTSAISALDMAAAWMREYFWDRREAVECALAAAGIAPVDEYDG